MPRKTTNTRGSGKKVIRVFCEGESEQAYTEFLKKRFSEVAVIKYPKATGLFNEAQNRFANDPQYRDYTNEIDEVWFFYDVELKDISLWEERYRIIKELRKLRRKPGIEVRLLLTTGCIEYWLMLHYQFFIPPLGTVSDKEKVMAMLVGKEPTYQKGELKATAKIAENYPTAVENAKKTLSRLLDEGMPGLEESDIRNQWLSQHCKTFSTVFEAVEFLLCL